MTTKKKEPGTFTCWRCNAAWTLNCMKWQDKEGRMLCSTCYDIQAQCPYCREIVPPEKYAPRRNPAVDCESCGPGNRQPLSIRQNLAWKAKSNLVRERSDKSWTDSI